jgi:N-acetyl-gamma-glutamylphosphate reductase
MKVLVTGANGFIGKNLVLRLREQADTEVLTYVRGQVDDALYEALGQCDAVVHLAGENRPADVQGVRFLHVKPELGMMLIFPSWLPHQVYPWQGSGNRRVIAWDCQLLPQ